MNNIELTEDQSELLEHLDNFIENDKLYFGVYGPAGSGKSFTIGYFIHSNELYTQTLFSGTTHNACKVLRDSIKNTAEKIYNENLNELFKEQEILKSNIKYDFLLHKKYINIQNNIDVNIDKFIIECCDILSLRYKKQFKTIHSIFEFEQSRDDKHNIIFIPKNSCYEKINIKNKIKYSFFPKFTVTEKKIYNSLLNDELKKNMELSFYRNKYKHFIGCKLLLCDESSMLKEFEFEYIKYICKILKVKIVFLGDRYQLPPVDDIQLNDINEPINEIENQTINFSSAVELKYSYTLKTIKRTNDKTLQEVYKSYRDIIENYYNSKIKLNDIRNIKYYIKNINTTDKYLINSHIYKIDSINYIKNINENNIRALCYTNNEVNIMNQLIRNILYDNPTEKYIEGEKLLVTKYMCLPKFEPVQLNKINECILSNNNKYTNYILEIITGLDIFNLNYNTTEETDNLNNIKNIFKYYRINSDNIKLYTGELLTIKEIIEKIVYINKKQIIINIIFCEYENDKTFFVDFKNEKDKKYVDEILSNIKNNIKFKCSLFKLHNCDDNCKMKCNKECGNDCNNLKHHYCNDCHSIDFHRDCEHKLQICTNNCNLVCPQCNKCNSNCDDCKNNHKNNYSKKEWEKTYDYVSYLFNPTINYSYATTVHKSQGQSIDNVIVCEYNIVNCVLNNPKIDDKNKIMLYLTSMYTAITRTKNILVRLK